MRWEVGYSNKSSKQKQLPAKIFDTLMTLEAEIEFLGPVQVN